METLEGTETPFTVWTDHKNLAYIQGAKHLNSRPGQVSSVLWQIQFQPHVPTRWQECQARHLILAVSRQTTCPSQTPSSLLLYLIGSLTWEIEALVRTALQTDPDPGGGPQGRLFVPVSVRSQVLQWCHTSQFACHPGSFRTLSLLQRHFWWPTMAADTQDYVKACTVCVPEGKLCIDHLQVSSVRSQCLAVPGPTSPWTLLLDCLYPKVMTPFLLLWIVSPKWYILWISLNFPQLQKLHNC